MAARKTRSRKKAEPSSQGLPPGEVAGGAPADELEALEKQILDHMEKAAARFEAGKVRGDQISRTAGD